MRSFGMMAWVALTLSAAQAFAAGLSDGHVDLAPSFRGDVWEWLVRDEDFNEYPLDEVLFIVGEAARSTAPANPAFAPILGPAGSPVWILPQSFSPGKLFLGFDGSGTGPGVFAGDRMALTLQAVSGPGEFALYRVDRFGVPDAPMNTRDGVSAIDDRLELNSAAGHAHYAWAFSAPGNYTVHVSSLGTLAGSGELVSDSAEWRFHVIPEPSTTLLSASGILLLARSRPRGRRVTS